MSIKNVIQVGAAGALGTPVLAALLGAGRFNVAVLSRSDSKSAFPEGVTVKRTDFSSHVSLVDALKGQDAVIFTLGASFEVMEKTQNDVIAAAIEAGVKYIVPSLFGANLEGDTHPIFVPKIRLLDRLKYLAKEGKINYIGIFPGIFYDWALVYKFLNIDLENRTATFIDDGTTKIDLTTVDSITDAIIGAISNPEAFKNRTLLIHDFFASQRDVLQVAEEVLGTKFQISHIDSKILEKETEEELTLIQAAMVGKTSTSGWGEDDDSKSLGLKKKDIREETIKVVKQLKLQ